MDKYPSLEMKLGSILLILAFLCPAPLQAVIIDDPTDPSIPDMGMTAPSDDPGWNHIGKLSGASCVYLGNGWVISCTHVSYGDPVFNGTAYPMIPGTNFTLKQTANPAADVDLTMFRINTRPSGLQSLTLPSLILGKDSPTVGTSVTAMGYGLNQESTTSTWNSLTGYKYASGAPKRWGTNTVEGTSQLNIGTWTNYDIGMTFNNGTPGNCQYAAGDSGGGMFAKDVSNQVWKLIGINEAISPQRTDAAVFGDRSFAVDLSFYRDQIVKAVQVFQLDSFLTNPNAILGSAGKQDWKSLQLIGPNAGFGSSTGNWNLPIDLNGYTLVVDSGTNDISMNGVISSSTGAGGLTKKGSGKLTLSATNTFGGNTTVLDGTLNASNIYSPTATVAVIGANSILNATSIAADTLIISSIATSGYSPTMAAESVNTAPEPSALVLITIALCGFLWRQRRKA